VAAELRSGVQTGALTWGESEQVLVGQALEPVG
jgi:hypothetical protein